MSAGSWVGGIAATVIAALAIWWLTHPGGLLVEEPSLPKPDVKILESDANNVYAGERSQATFTVYNEGEKAAERCDIKWYPGSGSPNLVESNDFSLLPKETKQISLSSVVYDKPGEFNSYAIVSWYLEGSQNSKSYYGKTASEYYYKTITVVPR